ncbi:unnamed protein product [Prorocentrum cordatum]|uniref:HYDIN/VesB/CFA65-like Ig-like domain-containing protein n=1 Tax=Prorocentrum cordatum TaxID=2364126 RepID=A0ABN9PIB1_9DINO|nr:unnamed protein product [Polarella glacialis]
MAGTYGVSTRSASQTRLPGGRGVSNSTMGMGERTTSLPALGTRAGAGRGYPSTSEAKGMKRTPTPSELLSQRRDLALVGASQPKITGFMDIGKYSNHTESAVPYDRPLFSVMPPVIAFQDFEGLQTYEATVTLRNQDKVARRVKVFEPDSSFFELRPGRNAAHSRRSSSGGSGDKVAPGMEVSYVVRFKPDAKIDYSYDLVVVTEREKFAVPIRASGGSALLTFPDEIDFGDECVVGHRSERTVLVRNVGDRTTKFSLRTHPPFSVTVPDGYLAEGAACQVSVYFTPDAVEPCVAEMQLRYEQLEATVRLRGGASNANISLSTDNLVIEHTYVGLEAQDTVIIRNESDVPVDFRWHLLPSQLEEHEHRRALQRHLKAEEGDEMLYLCQQHDEDSSEDSQSEEDGERAKARKKNKVTTSLSRKYSSINKAVKEDPMLFRDAIFAIEPLIGQIWPHSQVTCACTFLPKDALMYTCTAYLACVGQESRARLMLKGLGIGPKATFSYDELDVGSVFVDSTHRYEVQLLNQGDIDVDFRLVPGDTQIGRQFNFTPSSGTIAVGGHCEVVVDFKPKELGEFVETFEWALKGSNAPVTLCFRGVSVQPSFEFDVERLVFGTVSYGFLNSRMMALTNTSEVPCIYTLRIPEDERSEFDIIPSNGTLLPGCSQRVQVDFVSSTEKKYDLRLVVDLEGVGNELLSIPITAACAVPSVTFEPQAGLSYGDIFIRYPFHQSLYLHNTSALPAKFRVLQQEDKSRAEFEPDQWTGTVPPCASHVITVTLTAHSPGPLRISMYVKLHGKDVPFPLTLTANSVGPRVVVDPPAVDWGSVKCLEPVTRHVRVTNDSCIDATVRAFMNERRSLWSVHPKMMHLSPQETLQLAVTLKIDETCPVKDILNLIVSEGNDLTVEMRGKGTETPIQSEQPLDLIDFGTIFTTHQEPRDIVIRNYGQVARRLTWIKEKEKKKESEPEPNKKVKVQEKIQAFKVEPESVMLEPKTAYRFTFIAMSPKPGSMEDFLCCNEQVDKGGNPAKQIFRPRLRATFVAPQLKLSTTEIKFNFVAGPDSKVDMMSQTLTLENTSPLQVKCTLDAPYPFSASVGEATIAPGTELEVLVTFYPAHRVSRESGTVTKPLIIRYEDHPATNNIQLIGNMMFPNLELDSRACEFGTVLNETSKKINVKLTNPTSLQVCYHWCFSVQGEDEEEDANKQVPTGHMQASNLSFRPLTGNTTTTMLGNTGQILGSVETRRLEDGSRSPSAAPSPTSMMRTTHSVMQSAPQDKDDVDLNQVFDILPIFGKIDPGESQVVTFTYYGVRDRAFRASAVCAVDGGPEYEVKLSGSAAPCKYGLDAHELDFGDIPFITSAEQEVMLSNPGKVTTSFYFNLANVSRPGIVDVHPQSGVLNAGDKQKVQVRFRAGIPDRIEEKVLVEIAHFAPEVLTIRGNGTFPGVVLELPRWNAEAHEAGRREAVQRLTTSAPAAPPDASEAKEVSPTKAKKMFRQKNFDLTKASRSSTILDSGLDLLEVECEVDRFNLCNELLEQARLRASGGFQDAARSSTGARARMSGGMASPTSTKRLRSTRSEAVPTITAAHYVCDFGHLPLGHVSHRQIVILNGCSEAVNIAMDKTALQENGVTLEPEKIRSIPAKGSQALQLSATRPFEETEAKVEFDWMVTVKGGPTYKISMIANFVIEDISWCPPVRSTSAASWWARRSV